MKTFPLVLAAMLAATASVRSQNAPIAYSRESVAAPAITPTTQANSSTKEGCHE